MAAGGATGEKMETYASPCARQRRGCCTSVPRSAGAVGGVAEAERGYAQQAIGWHGPAAGKRAARQWKNLGDLASDSDGKTTSAELNTITAIITTM